MTTERSQQKERLNIERAIERIEWMHYLGTKTFPHDAGWDEGCELCNAEAEVRETLLAARRLEEQYKHLENELDDMTGRFCNEAIHLTRAEDRVRELEEQVDALREALRKEIAWQEEEFGKPHSARALLEDTYPAKRPE